MSNGPHKPKVSVIFPIYNNEQYVEKCVRGVMGQTLSEIELILIDDGSKDSAPDICDRLAKEDPRIRVVHKRNAGSAAGRNDGIELARGEYFAFVDPDDSTVPDMYEKLYQKAKETDADIVKCGFYYCENGKKHEATYFYHIAKENEIFEAKEKPEIFLYHASIWAAVFKREFVNKHHLRFIVTPSASYSDFSWMAMTYAYAKRITIYHKPLYNYTYDNPASSRIASGEKCFYKPFHCMESNRILREAGIFDAVKEQIGYHEYRTSIAHARRIKPELKNRYFEKLNELLTDITGHSFAYKEFHLHDTIIARCVLNHQEKLFYRLLGIETSVISFSHKYSFLNKLKIKLR